VIGERVIGTEGAVVEFEEGILEGVAEGVEGEIVWEKAEWIFEFVGDGFEGDVGVGDEDDDDWCHPGEAVDEAEGKEEAVDVYGTM